MIEWVTDLLIQVDKGNKVYYAVECIPIRNRYVCRLLYDRLQRGDGDVDGNNDSDDDDDDDDDDDVQ